MRKDTPSKFFVLFISIVITSLSTIAVGQYETEPLFILINERLNHMEDVALYKLKNHVAIEDLEREKIVIENALSAALEQGIEHHSIEAFFEAQIDVSKAIQYRHLADWLSEPNTSVAPDLQKVIRPAITELGESIILELATLIDKSVRITPQQRIYFHNTITTPNISEKDKDRLFDSLLLIQTQ